MFNIIQIADDFNEVKHDYIPKNTLNKISNWSLF